MRHPVSTKAIVVHISFQVRARSRPEDDYRVHLLGLGIRSRFFGLLISGFGRIAEDFVGDSFVFGLGRVDLVRKSIGLRDCFRLMSCNLAFVDLAVKILILVGMVEHLRVVRIRQNFSSVSQKNDSASLIVATERLQLAIHVHIVAAVAIIKVMMNAWPPELRYCRSLAMLSLQQRI